MYDTHLLTEPFCVCVHQRWSVGCLAEMYPDGKVGVDPVCVLGLNQNKGQKILLRLRTDDLQGFRKFLKYVIFAERFLYPRFSKQLTVSFCAWIQYQESALS
jgi:hypothetical protein